MSFPAIAIHYFPSAIHFIFISFSFFILFYSISPIQLCSALYPLCYLFHILSTNFIFISFIGIRFFQHVLLMSAIILFPSNIFHPYHTVFLISFPTICATSFLYLFHHRTSTMCGHSRL